MQDLFVNYLEELESCLSLSNFERLMRKAKNILTSSMFEKLQQCFEYEGGWLFVGLDFDSLEDKISAVTTNDPEKIKVYSDGFDGHCLRALAYFGEHMQDIELLPEGGTPYKTVVDGKDVYFHSNEEIDYMGQRLLGSELFALINK